MAKKTWIFADEWTGKFLELVVIGEDEEKALQVARDWYKQVDGDLEAIEVTLIDITTVSV